jgi:hypothetical protein
MKRVSLNKVMAKLAEEQKVELSMLGDYLDAFYFYRKNFNKAAEEVNDFLKSGSKFKQQLDELNADLVNTAKYYDKVEAEAKKLGVDLSSDTQASKREIDDMIKESTTRSRTSS